MFQPLRLNVINNKDEIIPLMLDVKDIEPYLYTMSGEPVEMIIRDDILWFNMENERYRAIGIPGTTAEQRYDNFIEIIRIRLEELKKMTQYLERERKKEIIKNSNYKRISGTDQL